MPQATDELRAKFPGWDGEAMDVIREHYAITRGGVIYPRVRGYKATPREDDAIDYLFREWDYEYQSEVSENSN